MNNIIAYSLFLGIIVPVIVGVGYVCYTNGNVYIRALIPNHADLAQRINKLLLIGYCLLNIGGVLVSLITWNTISTAPQLIHALTVKWAAILLIIGVIHYGNILLLKTQINKLI